MSHITAHPLRLARTICIGLLSGFLTLGCGGGGGSGPGGAPQPTVSAGNDRGVIEGTSVTLNASASGGSGDLTLQWEQTAGPAVASVEGGDGSLTLTAPAFTPGALSDNELSFRVRATDSRGGSATDAVTVSITPRLASLTAEAGFAYSTPLTLDDDFDYLELTIGPGTRFEVTLRTLDGAASASLAAFTAADFVTETLGDTRIERGGNPVITVAEDAPRTLYFRVGGAPGTRYTLTGIRTSELTEAGFPIDAPSPGQVALAVVPEPGGRAIGVANIDADDELEIVFTAGAALLAVNHDGSTVPGWPIDSGGDAPLITLANMDSDPEAEIAVAHAGGDCASPRSLLNGDGSAVSGWPISGCPATAPPTATEIGGSAALFFADAAGFTRSGTALGNWTIEQPGFGQPAIADIDGDDALDLAFSQDTDLNDLSAFDASGTALPGYPIQEAARGDPEARRLGLLGLPDFDLDGAHELIRIRRIARSRGDTLLVELYDSNAARLWRFETDSATTGAIVPAFGDLNGDGNPELVLQTDTELYAIERSMALLDGFPVALVADGEAPGTGASAPLIADVTGDGKTNIVVALPGALKIVDASGTVATTLPFQDNSIMPAVADIDLDGRNEIVAAITPLHAAPGEPVATLWVFDLGGADHGAVQWGQLGGDGRHQYRFPFADDDSGAPL
ncbi:MAG: hypothetical protein AAF515_21725 [Pseudomonadota bacterium]